MTTAATTNLSKSTNIEEDQKIDSLRAGEFDMAAIEKEAAEAAALHEQDNQFSGG